MSHDSLSGYKQHLWNLSLRSRVRVFQKCRQPWKWGVSRKARAEVWRTIRQGKRGSASSLAASFCSSHFRSGLRWSTLLWSLIFKHLVQAIFRIPYTLQRTSCMSEVPFKRTERSNKTSKQPILSVFVDESSSEAINIPLLRRCTPVPSRSRLSSLNFQAFLEITLLIPYEQFC